ncbi:MAG: hypothetical protein ACI8Y8_004107, partial [Planctomycetota bacterium]
RGVRRGQIEIHAWCVMTTHYHLLVYSPRGELSVAMGRAQNDYVRRFNRGRQRDGPLVRGRFFSKPVRSIEYREILVQYIDENPVQAGIVSRAADYPHGSAASYSHGSGPRWLAREWVEELVCQRLGLRNYDPSLYSRAFATDSAVYSWELVERRIAASDRTRNVDPLDHLVQAAPERVLRWLRAKARLADGSWPGVPVCDPGSVAHAVKIGRERAPGWLVRPSQKARDAWDVLEIGLLRDLAGATYQEIGTRTGSSAETAARIYRQHAALMRTDDEYAARAGEVARVSLRGAGFIAPGRGIR